ncbi:TIGR03751 family conjugal transfer lipoprotein [Pseudomonas batumici]|uniref:TIGR03751 family conjugal transfer lipoprotein n=1 Tax=Pseudomonas batumici TaxID=226910 RepID=UPI0030D421D3
MHRPSINSLACLWLITLLTGGCTTDKGELLPHGSQTMTDLWDQHAGPAPQGALSRPLQAARLALRRPLDDTGTDQLTYTRTAHNEIHSQFKRLPNPDLVMYVFPHLAGSDPVPVPGYSTVFPFYQRVQYALPGERTEAY